MCGIAGLIGTGDQSTLKRMTQSLAHRGPNGEGFFFDDTKRIFLGHRRLSVLDVEGGTQPMWDKERRVCVIFNGEIYNHRSLRKELTSLGYRFYSDHSDTEVLVHGYKEWGVELPAHLDGMFSYAVYDASQQRVVLVRDRFGEKPLFWSSTGDGLVFASELPAILQHNQLTQCSLNRLGLQKFFAHGFFPGTHTPYDGIQKLQAGHTLVFDIQSARLTLTRYWAFRIEPFEGDISSKRIVDWTVELQYLLKQAVASRLESDVPLGIFLSGGIDSSAILAITARERPRGRIKTFSIGFNEPSYDETAYIKQVARHFDCTPNIEKCAIDSLSDNTAILLNRIGEPIADSSILPTAQLCRFASQHVTVALSGDGGDELFAGYDPFKALRLAGYYHKWVPSPVHETIKMFFDHLFLSHANMSLDFKIRRALRGVGYRPAMWNPVWLGPLEPSEIEELFMTRIDPEELYAEAIETWNSSKCDNPIDRTLEFYTESYLQHDILVKTDRASMQSSLEVRSPFLSLDLVEFVRHLPWQVKYRSGTTKYILKEALKGLLPDEIIRRRKKGFGIPVSKWIETWPLPTDDEHHIYHADWLARRWEQHKAGKRDSRQALFAWLSLASSVRNRLDTRTR